MSMIIKNKIKALKKGYPTVSDKYNVAGGIVEAGANDLVIGELVQYTNTPGKYKPAVSVNAIGDIAGVALAVNARLNPVWPNDGKTELKVKAGEAFDLFVDGWIAVQLDDDVESDEVTPGKQAAVILSTGKITVADNEEEGIVLWPGAYFTGFTEGRLAELELRRI